MVTSSYEGDWSEYVEFVGGMGLLYKSETSDKLFFINNKIKAPWIWPNFKKHKHKLLQQQ